ncbi:MAG: VanZ family protein [Thermodesulfobacteriota bacterium]|nr:VanZ family protein [Thermodesulfobacteriota bacterium]
MALMFYLSGIPHAGLGLEGYEEQILRKSIHVIMYGILTFVLWFSLPKLDDRLFTKMLLCASIPILYAVSDELHQSLVPGRCGNIRGILFDLIGIILVLLWLWRRQKHASKALPASPHAQQ